MNVMISDESELTDLVKWLMSIENRASKLYASMGELFDEPFKGFCLNASSEELDHYNHLKGLLNNSNLELISQIPFKMDTYLIDTVEKPLMLADMAIKSGNLSLSDAAKYIIDIEFSEWNDLFILVGRTIAKGDKEHQYMASDIQRHKEEIVDFLKDEPYVVHVNNLHNKENIWDKKVLVVEDDEPIRNLLTIVLKDKYEVDTASDGVEALSKFKGGAYDVIVSDIQMPHMTGLEFYKQALEYDSRIKKRFMFVSAQRNESVKREIMDLGIPTLSKPIRIGELNDAVYRLSHSR